MSDLRQLILLIYEYLYNVGNRTEADYIRSFDDCYKCLFSPRPERNIDTYDFVKIVESKAKFDMFCKIQADLYEILKSYNKVE